MGVIAKEVAEQEVTAWLNFKQMTSKRREEKKDAVASLVGYIEDGIVTINSDTFELTQKLLFEIGNVEKVRELKWKPLGNVGKFQLHMKGVESTDFTGNCIANACAQTGQSKTIISSLDSEDAAIMKTIAVFFM